MPFASPPTSENPAQHLPARLRSRRLVLRQWSHDEGLLLHDAIRRSVEHLRPWMPWAKYEPLTVEDRTRVIENWTRSWESDTSVTFGVFVDGEVAGGAGLYRRGKPRTLDIGYWIHVDHLRNGYATEVTEALTTAAFEVEGTEIVRVQTDEANVASAGIPAKLGFTASRIVERPPEAPAESGRLIDWEITSDVWATRPDRLDR